MYSIENELKILRQFVKTGHEPRYNHADRKSTRLNSSH